MNARSVDRAEFLGDIIITAVEGGIGHWAVCRGYDYEDPYVEIGEVDFDDPYAEYPEDEWRGIDINTIAKGIGRVKDPEFRVNDVIRKNVIAANTKNDAGMIDAESADVIVQAALFGEIVYG